MYQSYLWSTHVRASLNAEVLVHLQTKFSEPDQQLHKKETSKRAWWEELQAEELYIVS